MEVEVWEDVPSTTLDKLDSVFVPGKELFVDWLSVKETWCIASIVALEVFEGTGGIGGTGGLCVNVGGFPPPAVPPPIFPL